MYILTNIVDVLFPTKNGDYSEYNADYEEYLEMNNRGAEKYNSDDVWEFLSELCSQYFKDDVINISHEADFKNRKVRVTGHVGRWDGVHEIVPKVFDNIKDCIEEISGGRYYHTFTLKQTGRWTFRYTESHHDSSSTLLVLKVLH